MTPLPTNRSGAGGCRMTRQGPPWMSHESGLLMRRVSFVALACALPALLGALPGCGSMIRLFLISPLPIAPPVPRHQAGWQRLAASLLDRRRQPTAIRDRLLTGRVWQPHVRGWSVEDPSSHPSPSWGPECRQRYSRDISRAWVTDWRPSLDHQGAGPVHGRRAGGAAQSRPCGGGPGSATAELPPCGRGGFAITFNTSFYRRRWQ